MTREYALQKIQTLLPALHEMGVRDIALFGSVARDTADESSDIDILIDFEPDQESFDNLLRIADLLEESFEAPVDIVTTNGLSPHVAEYVEREAVHTEST